jgi:cysteine dioxygenase
MNNKFSYLDELYEYLNKNYMFDNLRKYLPIIEKYNGIDYIKYINFSTEKYKRIKLDNYSNDKFELILICWNKDQITKIHSHSDNGCLMKILEGELEETLYDNNINFINKNIYKKDNVSFMHNDFGFHKIKAIEMSISLHLYSPPNYKAIIID